MFAILKKEFRLFFGSAIGYFIIGSFLTLNGLLLWVLKSDFNILDAGFADLTPFFNSTPWLFVLFIPALTMRSFSDEFSSGTIEILKTKPLSYPQLIGGKFLAILLLILIALVPTLLYVYSIYTLANPVGSIDFGSLIGSYIGLLFIASAFTSIGLWISTFSKNQLIVLLSSIALSFFLFYGINGLADLFPENSYAIQQWGMHAHFVSIGRGVLDTRDLLYFCSISILFLAFTYLKMSGTKKRKYWIYTLLFIVLLNTLGEKKYSRFDLTSDQRFTLSEASETIVKSIKEQLVIKVYLQGEFPSEFKRLQVETQQLLEEIRALNPAFKILFIDPKNKFEKHIKNGLTPSRLTVEENGVVSERIILPWATIFYKNKTEHVSLLKDSNAAQSQGEQLENSIQNLEYAFSDALKKISSKKKKSIAILTGNGELEDIHLYSFLKTLGAYYHLAKFTLDSVATNPKKTLEQLNTYDLAVIAKPTERFTEQEKYVLDQYTLKGGNSIWMLDYIHAEMDSLLATGKTLTYPRDLNLDDFFFRYGARFNPNLIKDLYASKIALATGNTGNQPNFKKFLWLYHPLVTPRNEHPIVNNIAPVNFQFASSIDTLRNDLSKTILLKSSVLSTLVKTPAFIELKSVAEKPNPQAYKNGNKTMALLLEGNFTSAYKDRLKPLNFDNAKEKGTSAKMILIADGDIASNQIHQGKPLELGVDKWTQQYYGNKEFLMNAFSYLLDDTGLISIRSKTISLPILDKNKALQSRSFWQALNLLLPLVLLSIFGFGFSFLRKRKYGRPIS